MTFAKLCPHGNYDVHSVMKSHDVGGYSLLPCPGGTLLPPDSLVISDDARRLLAGVLIRHLQPQPAHTFAAVVSEFFDALAAAQPGRET